MSGRENISTVIVVSLILLSNLIIILPMDTTSSSMNNLPNPLVTNSEFNSSNYPFSDHYPSVEEYYDWFENISNHYSICERIKIGRTWEGRNLWVIKISDNVEQNESEPEILIDAGIHAREWSGPQVASYFLWRILNGYESNDTIHWLVNNREIFVLPLLNPDGYYYDGNGDLSERFWWRKNRNDSIPGGEIGVDLNRNWDIKWEQGIFDSSSDLYHGIKPFSEYETRSYRRWILKKDIQSYQNIHSYYGTLLIPWSWTDKPSPHDEWYRHMAKDMTSLTSIMGNKSKHYHYGQADEEIDYTAYGSAADWVYENTGAHGLSFELYTEGGFYPDEEYIMTINKDVFDSLVYQVRIADIDLGDGTNKLHPPAPYILYGTVKDGFTPLSNEAIKIKNLRTGEIISTKTDERGYYELNFGTFTEHAYYENDTFKIISEEVDLILNIGDEWGDRYDIDYSDKKLPQILDVELSKLTTGDAALVRSIVTDDNDVRYVFFNYSTDVTKEVNLTLDSKGGNEYVTKFTVPRNATKLVYTVSARDNMGNWNKTEIKIVKITDNDEPVLIFNNKGNPTTGDNFTFECNAYDNWELEGVYLNYQLAGYKINKLEMDHSGGARYSKTIRIPSNCTNIEYRISAEDKSGYMNSTDHIKSRVVDNDPPSIVDITNSVGFTGDSFTFSAEIHDNIDIENARVTYWYEGKENIRISKSLEKLNNSIWTSVLTVPINYTGNLYYNLSANDTSNNSVMTKANEIEIKDNDPPKVSLKIIQNISKGERIQLSPFQSKDNIGVINYTWIIVDGGNIVKLYSKNVSYVFKNPGNHSIELVVKDAAGNSNSDILYIHVKDRGIIEFLSSESNTILFIMLFLVGLLIMIFTLYKGRENKKI